MNKIVILANDYPYGRIESFLENELRFMGSVVLVSCHIGCDTEKRVPPPNVTILRPDNKFFNGNKLSMALNMALSLLRKDFWKELTSSNIRPCSIRKAFRAAKTVACAEQITRYVRTSIKNGGPDKIVYYSYWMNHLALSAVKLADQTNGVCCSRCHGFDLYKRSDNGNYVPFQQMLLKRLDRVFPISDNGKQTLLKLSDVPDISEKIQVQRLGTDDYGEVAPKGQASIFTIVSCSYVTSVKRVHLIYKAIQTITSFRIRWIHFGNGELFNELSELITTGDSLHQIELRGYVPNREVLEFYKTNVASVFVNASSYEGIPVSIMEALSFGIPCIAPNICGIGEIIKDGVNGFLLDPAFQAEDLASVIVKMHNLDRKQYEELTRGARRVWEQDYNAENNYTKFHSILSTL